MNKVTVDIDKAGAVAAPVNDVGIPDFLIERARFTGHTRVPNHKSGHAKGASLSLLSLSALN